MSRQNCMASSDCIKQGYVKIKSKKLGIWKTYWVILRSPSSRGCLRLQKFSSEKASERDAGCDSVKFEPLDSSTSINIVPADIRKHAIVISSVSWQKPDNSLFLAMDSEYEMSCWYDALNEAKDLYGLQCEQFTASNTFHVNLLPTPALNCCGEYLLRVTASSILILDPDSNPPKAIVAWPLNVLRKYGRDSSKFTIESGRCCQTGEGLFVFNSYQSEQIYQTVSLVSSELAAANDVDQRSLGTASPGASPGQISRRNTDTSENSRTGSLQRNYQSVRRPLPPVPADKYSTRNITS